MARPISKLVALVLTSLLTAPVLAGEETAAPASQPKGSETSQARRAARGATRAAARAARAAAVAAAEAAKAAAQVAVEAAEAAAADAEDGEAHAEQLADEAERAAEHAAEQAEKAAEAAERAAEEAATAPSTSQPADEPTADAPPATDADAPDDDGAAHPSTAAMRYCQGALCLEPGVRLRVRYDAIEDDEAVAYVGRNDGFALSSGRFKLRGRHGDWLRFSLVFEGGFVDPSDGNLVAGRTFVAFKDAWLDVRPFDFFQVRVGQFKAPFNLEAWRSTASLRFVESSVSDRGIRLGQGYQTLGLSPDRELGVMVGSQDFRVGPVSLLYLVSATNGNGVNEAFNDNSFPALHGRFELGLWDWVRLGGGALYNPRTVGALPNLYDEADLGFTGDLQVRALGAFVDASVIWVNTAYPTTGAPDSAALAVSVEAGYVLWFGLGAGYRFAWFDPTSQFDYDAVTEHSVGLRYDLPSMPVALVLDYTFALEQPGRDIANNRLAGLVQLDF